MRGKRLFPIFVAGAIALSSLSAAVAAESAATATAPSGIQMQKEAVDPLQRLENEKTRIEERLANGEITQEQADEALAQIEQRIEEMEAFNQLSTDEKKAKLLSDCTTKLDQQVEDGKMTQEEADTALAEYKTKLEEWDGSGYLPFMGMGNGPQGMGPQEMGQNNGSGTIDTTAYKDGVVLKIGRPNALVKGAKAKIDQQNTNVAPVVVGGRTMVPLRFVSEAFGAEVNWDASTRQVTIKNQDKSAVLTVGSKEMTVDSSSSTLDVAPQISNGRVLVPLRAVAENILGKKLAYTNGVIYISDQDFQLDDSRVKELTTVLQ